MPLCSFRQARAALAVLAEHRERSPRSRQQANLQRLLRPRPSRWSAAEARSPMHDGRPFFSAFPFLPFCGNLSGSRSSNQAFPTSHFPSSTGERRAFSHSPSRPSGETGRSRENRMPISVLKRSRRPDRSQSVEEHEEIARGKRPRMTRTADDGDDQVVDQAVDGDMRAAVEPDEEHPAEPRNDARKTIRATRCADTWKRARAYGGGFVADRSAKRDRTAPAQT